MNTAAPGGYGLVALVALAFYCALTARAASPNGPESSLTPQAAIENRQAGFKKMGAAMKALADQLKTDAPASAVLVASSQAVVAHAQEQFRWFPAGSGAESGVETDALPNIWKDRARFDALAEQLTAETRMLAATVARNDLAAVKAQVKAVGSVCSDCHRSYRAD